VNHNVPKPDPGLTDGEGAGGLSLVPSADVPGSARAPPAWACGTDGCQVRQGQQKRRPPRFADVRLDLPGVITDSYGRWDKPSGGRRRTADCLAGRLALGSPVAPASGAPRAAGPAGSARSHAAPPTRRCLAGGEHPRALRPRGRQRAAASGQRRGRCQRPRRSRRHLPMRGRRRRRTGSTPGLCRAGRLGGLRVRHERRRFTTGSRCRSLSARLARR
jgi:hypothetical protein